MVARLDMLRELRSETTPWSFSVCLMVGQGLNLGSTGWLCVVGSMVCLCTPLKWKAKLCVYVFLDLGSEESSGFSEGL